MKPMLLLTSIFALGALAAAGCSSGSTSPSSSQGADAGTSTEAGPTTEPVAWTPCPLHSEGTGTTVECATIKAPLDAAAPNGPTIDVFVKRYRPAGGKSLRALWMLQGGPGGSGYPFEGISESIATKFPDVDFYIPDHRGTGRSTRLGCPTQEAESEA